MFSLQQIVDGARKRAVASYPSDFFPQVAEIFEGRFEHLSFADLSTEFWAGWGDSPYSSGRNKTNWVKKTCASA
jgi:hypothetical protein